MMLGIHRIRPYCLLRREEPIYNDIHDDGILELAGVPHGLSRWLLDDVSESVLVVRESFFDASLGRIQLFEGFQRRVHLLTDSFPLMSNSSVRASCWRAQPVTNIDSPISNPTRVGFSGISVVSSTSYSTATSSVHALRCFCKRSSPLSYLIPHQASRPTSSGST